MKRYYLILLIILLHNSYAGGSIPNINDSVANNSFTIPVEKITSFLKDAIIKNSALVDKNGDKIADYLDEETGMLDLVLVFENYLSVPESIAGIDILESFQSIPAIHVITSSDNLSSLSSLPGLSIIEGNLPVTSKLAYSTNQMDVRDGIWAEGFTGSTEYSIAVLDTGIDTSHSAFDGRLLASYNAMDNTPPIDGEGHGTHVSGIAAGNFNMDQTVIQTSRGILPEDGFLYLDISVPNMNKTVDITVGVDWAEKGMDFPGTFAGVHLLDAHTLERCTGCSLFNDNGYLEATFSVPGGDYVAAFANHGAATGQFYEGWVKMPLDTQLPSVVNNDGFPQYAGIAHSTNLVSVKVLDNDGVGKLVNIISGIDWVIANKDKYKIVVVNLSLGIDEVVSSLDSLMTSLVENGILPVVAAGNDGPNSGGIFSPGSSPDALTVGAVNRFNEVAFYSSVGSNSANKFSSKPDVLAPGGSYALASNDYATSYTDGVGLILSADNNYIGFSEQENDLIGYQGTSMAAPHVAGLAALLIESYTNGSAWTWNAYDVRRIKQAILAGTFEVANIGLAGGENFVGDPDPSPTIDRSSKDYYEGWGMISAKAAFDALSKSSYFGTKIVSMEHENPFGIKVSSSTLFATAGKSYTFTAEAPEGADIDLLVFKAGGSDDGDLEVLFSSISSSKSDATNDESITFSTPTDTELMLVVRMVDSDNSSDDIIISVLDPNFIPFVKIFNPVNNSIINYVNVPVVYESTTNPAEFYLDEYSLGVHQSGYMLSNTDEGEHNLTLKETNDNTGNSFSSKINFTVDLTNPQLTVHNSTITSLSNIYSFRFDASDNIQLSKLDLLVDGELYNSSSLFSDVFDNTIDLNPYYFNFGLHAILLILYDEAGNSDSIEIKNVSFDHDTFISIQPSREFEYGAEISVTWEAGVDGVTPLSYVIYLDNVEYVTTSWNGAPITIQFPVLELGLHEVKIDLTSSSSTISGREYWDIMDTTMPIITGPVSGLYDSTIDHEIKFEIIELLPKELNIFKDGVSIAAYPNWDGNNDNLKFLISGEHGEVNTYEVILSDEGGNLASHSSTIIWSDLTEPVFTTVPNDIQFIEGSANQILVWEWIEKTPRSIELYIDEILDTTISVDNSDKFTISLDDLNQLAFGSYIYRLEIVDKGDIRVFDEVRVLVTVDSTVAETPSFIPVIFSSISVALVTITFLRRRNII